VACGSLGIEQVPTTPAENPFRIPAHQVSPHLRSLFDVGQPMAIRCFAVLDGLIRGQIWTMGRLILDFAHHINYNNLSISVVEAAVGP
jgi:hypothetical protein